MSLPARRQHELIHHYLGKKETLFIAVMEEAYIRVSPITGTPPSIRSRGKKPCPGHVRDLAGLAGPPRARLCPAASAGHHDGRRESLGMAVPSLNASPILMTMKFGEGEREIALATGAA